MAPDLLRAEVMGELQALYHFEKCGYGEVRSRQVLSWFVAIETSESVFREIFNHSDDIAELIIRGNGLNASLPGVNKLLLVNCVNRIKSLVI